MHITGYMLANYMLCAVLGVLMLRAKAHKLRELQMLLGVVLAALFCNTLELSMTEFAPMLFFNQLKFVGVVFISPATLFLYLRFLKLERYITKWTQIIVTAIPVTVILAIASNPLHHLFYTEAMIQGTPYLTYIQFEPAYIFWVNSAYSYSLIVGALVLLLVACFKKPAIYRGQNYVIIAASLVAIGLNLLVIFGFTESLGDFSIVAFAIAALFHYWGICVYKPVKMIRLARSIAINEISNPVFIFDNNNVVLDQNIIAAKTFPLDDSLVLQLQQATDGELDYNGQSFSVTEKKLYNKNDVYFGRALVLTDITKMKETVEKLEFALSHDVLTGLSTRDDFKKNFISPTPEQLPLGILYFNICAMKVINNALGYQFGDMVIQFVAETICHEIKGKGLCGRMNGDEFAVVLFQTDEKETREIAERINRTCMEKMFNDIFIGLYIGVAAIKDKSHSFEIELKNAIGETNKHKLVASSEYYLRVFHSFESVLKEERFSKPGSIDRIKELCGRFAAKAGMEPEQTQRLMLLSSTYNIGLLNTNEKIIEKLGSLSNEEWADYKLHTVRGYNIALTSQTLFAIANDILHHHERYDGLGYPLTLKGDQISYLARVLAVMIYYDEQLLTGASHEEAVQSVAASAGKRFDPQVAGLFIEMFE